MAYRRRDVAGARQAFEQAIQQDATHCVEGYTNLALVLREANPTTPQEWGAVVRNIRSALALDDRYLPARTQLALSYLQQAGDDPNSRMIFLAGLVCAQAAQVAQSANADLAPDVRSFTGSPDSLARLDEQAERMSGGVGQDIQRFPGIARTVVQQPGAQLLGAVALDAVANGDVYGTINLSFRGYQDAKEAFEHAIALRDDSYDAHIGLGVALRGLALTQPDTERAQTLARAQQEYERARTLDANRPDAYYNLGVLNMNYMGGAIPVLRTARELLQQFVQRAGSTARFVTSVGNATRHIRNIEQTITALEAVGGGAAPAPATPAATPPAAAPAATPAPAAAPAPAAGQTPAPGASQ